MIQFCAGNIWAALFSLDSFYKTAQDEVGLHGAASKTTPEYRQRLIQAYRSVEQICQQLELAHSLTRISHFLVLLKAGESFNTEVASEIHGLRMAIIHELQDRWFAFIPTAKVLLFEKETLFGQLVNQAFPEATQDIKDAGNCLAVDLNTTAVFHLMRVTELAVRKISKHLKVKIKGHIEFATWGEITRAIDDKLKELKGGKRTPARESKLELYSGMLLDIRSFQYLWRDPVSHVRITYDYGKALSAFNHVSDFMQRAAKIISKTK